MNNKMLRLSVIERERNHCLDDSHVIRDNCRAMIRTDDSDDQKPIDLKQLESSGELHVLEFGGLRLERRVWEIVTRNPLKCLRIYDCSGLTDDSLKIIGENCGKSLVHLEAIGFSSSYTVDGLRSLVSACVELRVLHCDSVIPVLASVPVLPHLRHLWSKVSGEFPAFTAFRDKYATQMDILDLTFSGTKDETPKFVESIGAFKGLTRLSLTATGQYSLERELGIVGNSLGKLRELNLCIWNGSGNELIAALAQFTPQLERLTLNCRSPMNHLDVTIAGDLSRLSILQQLKQFRLVMKRHAPTLFTGFCAPNLEILELCGLNVTDATLDAIHAPKLAYLDVTSPLITDAGIASVFERSDALCYLRVNGTDTITNKSLDAVVTVARNKRHSQQVECVFNSDAKIDLESRRANFPPNLIVTFRDSQFCLNFPASTPRAF